jgi:hypothetical protein
MKTIEELSNLGYASAKKYALLQGIPRNTNRVYDKNPPQCTTPGCTHPKTAMEYHWITGKPIYRPICRHCHEKNTAGKHGLTTISQVVAKNAGFSSVEAYYQDLAKKAGFESYNEYKNSIHPYLKYRKTYCENIDGRLGFVCTTSIVWNGMLDVDHIDGNPFHNSESNLQTLCKCCHSYKTNKSKDFLTPGRKSKIK